VVIGIVLPIVAIPLILLLILHVLASDVTWRGMGPAW
jgi:hypothetical protein